MKIGIFFGGQSREREVSFAGGRTVYDNLNKGLFEPVPIFVDSLGNFILLNWEYVYKGTIRDFYPPVNKIPASLNNFQIYVESLGKLTQEEQLAIAAEVGRKIEPQEFKSLFDFAFLALHGPYGEDGSIQGLLEWYQVPYSGSGILPVAIGIDKAIQRDLFNDFQLRTPKSQAITRADWQQCDKAALLSELKDTLGLPLVIKAAHQGSSIGVSIIEEENLQQFTKAVELALFEEEITATQWNAYTKEDKVQFIANLIDIRQGIGMPLLVHEGDSQVVIYHPEELLSKLDTHFANHSSSILLSAVDGEEVVLFEAFIEGKEFSCIVLQDEAGNPIALPPTEIIKGKDVFDYRSKYLPGMTRKITPINLSVARIKKIQEECCELFQKFHFNVYARLDGFITDNDEIFLNDPNTTSGMMPSSFFFHQAAEIGLNPSQFLTYIIRTSLQERIKTGKRSHETKALLAQLDANITGQQTSQVQKSKVAVLLGGYSSERHISVESGRNIYEKLASSDKYEPIPIFLTGNEGNHQLYQVPTNILLKDNADDIRDKVAHALTHPMHEIIASTIEEGKEITSKYAGNAIFKPRTLTYEQLKNEVDFVFIALHGRPGEDGAVQQKLETLHIPYNGSPSHSSQVTIDKYETNEILRKNGVSVAAHWLVPKEEWQQDHQAVVAKAEKEFGFPLIAKPADDGCSSAVKKIDNAEELIAFGNLMFRAEEALLPEESALLKLSKNEEFPQKEHLLLEELIGKQDADHFLEITGGLLTHQNEYEVSYEVFEPSEALASDAILSLEEKFLAGEGQNITPARFSRELAHNQHISEQVRAELKKVAQILQVEGYARIDAFVRISGDQAETIIIEVNSLPGMTPATCIFHQSAINGYTPFEFIDRIIHFGIQRQQIGVQ